MLKQLNWKHFALLVLAMRSSLRVSDQQVQVVVSSQDADGITQEDMSIDFLKNLEAYTVERFKVRTAESLASQGYADLRVEVNSEATYVESGPIKLAVIRLRSSGDLNQVFIAGIVGKELKRVGCVRSSPGSLIPISYGACGEKIKEVFGTGLVE
ncbi:MAG: hypothetical protein HYV04_12385 [Deltaproteobacteria bacterium]|nr:hypothetical protein [Deltaproteobacteria bacterium]